MMRSGNPVLNSKTFDIAPAGERMTIGGTVNKTAILLALVLITAIYTWGRFYSDAATPPPSCRWSGPAPSAASSSHWSPSSRRNGPAVTAPIYALLEGLVVGGISAIFEVALSRHRHPGRGPHLRHARLPAAGVQVRAHQGDRKLQARRRRGHRRHRAALPRELRA